MLDLDKETRRLVTELRETHEQVNRFLRRKLRPKSWRAWEVPLAQAQAFNSRRKRHPTLIYLVFSKETPPRLLKKVVRVSNIVFRIMYRNGAASRALSSVINLRQSRLMAKIEWPETPPPKPWRITSAWHTEAMLEAGDGSGWSIYYNKATRMFPCAK